MESECVVSVEVPLLRVLYDDSVIFELGQAVFSICPVRGLVNLPLTSKLV